MKKLLLLLTLTISIYGFAQNQAFDEQTPPPAPDYAKEANWSALPFRTDAADAIPKSEDWIGDSVKEVDVFYIHPTMYLRGKDWNADVTDKRINRKVDKQPVHYQASVFNNTCRVYAPRYRQAIVKVFRNPSDDGEKALELAYADVKNAFDYYLKNYNNGRPIIIASHSQGTRHAKKLLQDYFDGKELHEQLVAAYIIGYTVKDGLYQELKLCNNPNETGCFITWESFKYGHEPDGWFSKETICVNPLTWTTDTAYIDASEGLGTVVLNLNKKYHSTGAQIHQNNGNYLWIKTKAPWFPLFKNMHILDYNLFWHDIRQNVKDRIEAYLADKR